MAKSLLVPNPAVLVFLGSGTYISLFSLEGKYNLIYYTCYSTQDSTKNFLKQAFPKTISPQRGANLFNGLGENRYCVVVLSGFLNRANCGLYSIILFCLGVTGISRILETTFSSTSP